MQAVIQMAVGIRVRCRPAIFEREVEAFFLAHVERFTALVSDLGDKLWEGGKGGSEDKGGRCGREGLTKLGEENILNKLATITTIGQKDSIKTQIKTTPTETRGDLLKRGVDKITPVKR